MDRLTATNRLNDGGRLLVENPQAADLDAPLTNSIIPQRGVGAISYTRATIATVTDHEWVMHDCIAGEARFQGARRVRNYYKYSQDITNVIWTKGFLTATANTAIAPDGTLTADSLTSKVGTNPFTEIAQAALTTVIGNTYLYSMYVKDNGQRYLQLIGTWLHFWIGYVNFDLQTGTITATSWAMTWSIANVGNGWYRIMVSCVAIGAALNGRLTLDFIDTATSTRWSAYTGDWVKGIYIWWQQFEDVTGQSIQTPSEYVSTNVLTTAPFHGSNVDGVKCFKTTIAWLPISPDTLKGFLCEWARTNICNYSNIAVAWWGLIWATRTDNAWIAPDGSTSFVKIIPNAGTQSSYAYNVNITTTAQVYSISCYVKAAWMNYVQLLFSSPISSGYANFDLLNWVVGTRSIWTSSGIEPVAGFPWVYRIWAVTDAVAAATAAIVIKIVSAANSVTGTAVTWDWVSGVMAWGMQIELWPSVSSYIPTTTTTVTRNIDVLLYNVRNAIANQWALSVVCSMDDNEIFDRRALNLSSFTINRLHIQLRTLWVPNVGIVYWDGVTVRGVIGVAAWTNNIAVAWTNWVWLNLYMNNIKYIGNFVPSLAFTIIDVGGGSLWYPIFWCTKNLRIWKTVPTDAELLSLSNQS